MTRMGLRVASLEDDAAEAARIREIVTAEGHECVTFADGRRMLVTLRKVTFDLLLLDWHVPHVSGREVLDWVRAHLDPRIPVMFLTGRDTEADIVATLSAGADDYMVKPIRPRELGARIAALLRRAYPDSRQPDDGRLTWGCFRFDAVTHEATCHGQEVRLTPKEFEVALLLFRNEGRAVPREYMLAAIWGKELPPLSRTIDTHVSRVRTKLGLWEHNGVRLQPLYTHGYRLELLTTSGTAPPSTPPPPPPPPSTPPPPPQKKKGTRRCLSAN
ncbi:MULTISPECIES: response regulator transcription factor [Cupriavidus]|jgi:DNA-binding response OmpR family regulator|uniref:Response regulator transcription factor n=1 Tax=Cupriavidus metallidurans TaxID=119219 RepID=A0A482IIT9_9BURK|nr:MULTISPECIES: response regulator transcription factor [Cupriavidus]KWR86675.1 two-component system response regulator [Cupriavidus sp. SHE]QBP08252.1 response regulator transcription factor [Cupriavidus metallidurans]QWC88652.1 response regulator transcription factor [Cupriavidus metallidurans]